METANKKEFCRADAASAFEAEKTKVGNTTATLANTLLSDAEYTSGFIIT